MIHDHRPFDSGKNIGLFTGGNGGEDNIRVHATTSDELETYLKKGARGSGHHIRRDKYVAGDGVEAGKAADAKDPYRTGSSGDKSGEQTTTD